MNKKSSWHFAILSISGKRKILKTIKRPIRIRFEQLIRVIRGPIQNRFFLKKNMSLKRLSKVFSGKRII